VDFLPEIEVYTIGERRT